LAEDIARGNAQKTDCIHILKKYIHHLTGTYDELAEKVIDGDEGNPTELIHDLLDCVNKLSTEIAILDAKQKRVMSSKKTE
jgi:hypothetical protein